MQSGTPDLKSERGRYWSYGFVWSPSSRFDFSADYYHIQIDDLLTTLDPDKLLRDEAACRSGGLDQTRRSAATPWRGSNATPATPASTRIA